MTHKNNLYKIAFGLAVFTIVYNIAEGLISTYLGFEDESLALFGFGSDSFIEVISGLGIAHMILRIQNNPNSKRDDFERTALRITGIAGTPTPDNFLGRYYFNYFNSRYVVFSTLEKKSRKSIEFRPHFSRR